MTSTVPREEILTWAPAEGRRLRVHNRLLTIMAVVMLVLGIGSVLGGAGGAIYTYNQAVAQNVTTPDDAVITEAPVRGPFTMWAQADIINTHQLESTEGLYYAEMPRQIPQLDEAGNPVLDETGAQVMVSNPARATWITATALISALNLGILAYALATFAVVVGLAMIGSGVTFLALRTPQAKV